MNKKDSEFLIAQEKVLLDPKVRKSATDIERLLAPEFVEFGGTGRIYNRLQIVEALLREEVAEITPSDFKTVYLSDDIVLLTYKSARVNSEGSSISLRSSIWKKLEGQWQMVFHQGTKVFGEAN